MSYTTDATFNAELSSVTTSLQSRAVHTLPAESLASIFIHCLHPSPFSYKSKDDVSVIPRRIPIILASVCNSWREVACNTPELWSTCWLRYDRPELHSLWLDRASTRPLHLNGLLLPPPSPAQRTERPGSFRLHPTDYIQQRQTNACALGPFLKSILPYANQWASFIICSDVFAPEIAYTLPENQFYAPRLELFHTLSAYPAHAGSGEVPAELTYWTRAILQQSPKLQHLKLWENAGGRTPKSLEYTNLANLQLRDAPGLWCIFELLQNAPMLQSLKICGSIQDSHPKDGSEPLLPVHHPHLTELRISLFRNPRDFNLLLDSLTLPALHSFDFRVLWVPQQFRTVVALFERSGSSLRKLHLRYGMVGGSRPFISILQSRAVNPWLHTLILGESALTDQLIQFLTIDSDTINLPQLRRLSFSGVLSENSLETSITDMVVSRRQKPGVCERLQYFSHTTLRDESFAQYEADVWRLSAYAKSTVRDSIPLVVRFGYYSRLNNCDDEKLEEEEF